MEQHVQSSRATQRTGTDHACKSLRARDEDLSEDLRREQLHNTGEDSSESHVRYQQSGYQGKSFGAVASDQSAARSRRFAVYRDAVDSHQDRGTYGVREQGQYGRLPKHRVDHQRHTLQEREYDSLRPGEKFCDKTSGRVKNGGRTNTDEGRFCL